MTVHREKHSYWRRDGNDFLRAYYWQARCRMSERLFKILFRRKTVGRAHHIVDLEQKVERQRRELENLNDSMRYRNEQLKATNIIVNCTGCDAGFPGDMSAVTEETVKVAESTVSRLRTWWDSHAYREAHKEDRKA